MLQASLVNKGKNNTNQTLYINYSKNKYDFDYLFVFLTFFTYNKTKYSNRNKHILIVNTEIMQIINVEYN